MTADILAALAAPFRPDIVGDERGELLARFWSQVAVTDNPADCWTWRGGCVVRETGKQSYGRFTVRGEHIYAHRFSYQILHGALPDDLVVRHKCDNEPCVNPRHLLSGTVAQNTHDKFERGRGADRKGEKHPLARLTADDVREIRRLRSLGHTEIAVAEVFSVARQQVGKITRRQNWGHIA